jgi:hypothetical protein
LKLHSRVYVNQQPATYFKHGWALLAIKGGWKDMLRWRICYDSAGLKAVQTNGQAGMSCLAMKT